MAGKRRAGGHFPVVSDYVCLALAAFLVVYAALRVEDNSTLGVFFGMALLLAGRAPARRIDEYLRGESRPDRE